MLVKTQSEHATTFSLATNDNFPASIVVEVPTLNESIFFGANDIREEDARVNKVVATSSNIYICKENGDEFVAPVSVSGLGLAKIYQFGDELHHYVWKKSKDGKIDIACMF